MSYFLCPHLIGLLEARENCFFAEERAKFDQGHLNIYREGLCDIFLIHTTTYMKQYLYLMEGI
jgi:hypothetical protein